MAQRFGEFELVRRLGSGGMAEVHVARRRGPSGVEEQVCLKRILPAWSHDPRMREMLVEEGRVGARLRHPSVVQLLEAGERAGEPFLALELVEGADLRRLAEATRTQGGLTGAALCLVALDVATALEVAHRAGVLHRDVSPSNVLVSRRGAVKLGDFGIAKADDSQVRTATGMPKGKPSYMAPEYALTGLATVRSDLYALGLTLYEAATGHAPFRGGDRMSALARAQANLRPHVHELAPALPPALAHAIEWMVQADPARRPPSAAAVFESLAGAIPGPGARRALGTLAGRLGDPARGVRARRAGTPFDEGPVDVAPVGVAPVGVAPSSPPTTRPGGRRRPTLASGGSRRRAARGRRSEGRAPVKRG